MLTSSPRTGTSCDNIARLMAPRSIAILGCSENNAGGTALQNLLANGYKGRIYPVHPAHDSVAGLDAYPTLESIPADVDCCIIALRAELVPDAIDQLHAKGISAAVIFASGFGELGEHGNAIQADLSRKLAEYGIAACGPNCLGVLSFEHHTAMYYAGIDLEGRRGPIGFVSHSGSSCIAVTNADRGTGFSYVISCGNEAGLSVADYVRFLADDPATEVIGLHLEAVRDAAGLAEAARYALTQNKPVVVLKLGRTDAGQRTAAAHSGALATPHALAEAYFARHGMILVDSLEEFLETCELMVHLRSNPPTSDGVAVTAVSGGMAGLSADIGTESGVRFAALTDQTRQALTHTLTAHSTPANPLDVTLALNDPAAYRRCIEILDEDPTVGLIVVCQGAEPGLNEQQRALYAPIGHMVADLSATIRTPIVSFSPVAGGLEPTFNRLLRSAGVAHLMGAVASLKAVRNGVAWCRGREQSLVPPHTSIAAPTRLPLGDQKTLSEHRGKQLLASYGIATPKEIMVNSASEAAEAADQLGYPVVLKVDTPDITHKTDAGIVALGLTTSTQVRDAYTTIVENAHRYAPGARINGVSVQELVRPGIEMMIGVKNDPMLGPAVVVGAGGIYTEILNDVAVRLAPITPQQAEDMITSLRSYPLLRGARGTAPADVKALTDAVHAVGALAWHYRDEIEELDINPAVVLDEGSGLVALDALVVRKD
ncbi:acetate--CoA ligase family protein [Rhodococcus jostii]|uniref:Acyl-CoA synthetase (NDP forming) n=1 Tax=Rhodococcus jostii TaxID=132919 RepID=A0A1H4JAI2_RHOJO|nr:acetate--CoA ligase family protein [Rhodococcus jostii]SEB42996.1 Acyl-CoA synthetase (NDP forming) [Rhodococcus jostii]